MKRWTLPIALLVLGTLLAIGAGWGANTALGAAIGLRDGEVLDKVGRPTPRAAQANTETPSRDSVAPPRAVNRKTRRQYVDAILARNIFDHTKVGVTAEDGEPCEGEDCDGVRSDLPVVLLATLVAQPAEFSSALLFDENKKEAWGYGVGDKILDAEIVTISEDRVVVKRGDGSQEFIEVGDAERPERTASASNDSSGDEGIMKEGDDSYVVSRDLVDNALSNLDDLAKMARARPHKDADGNVDGFRLSGVRRNKLVYQLGIRSGDVVHSVNGQPLTSIQEAMGALTTMQNGSSFSFEISRRGERKTMSYNVR